MITPVLRAKILIPTAFVSLIGLFSFSYYITVRFAGAGDRVIYGKKQSDLAAEIRDELLARSDTQEVSYRSSDGTKISGIFFKRKNAKANMLCCHGYRGNKEFMFGLVNLFPEYNLLFFDFRAHGQSGGSYISLGCHEYKDVLASAEFLKNKAQKEQGKELPFILLGISMGGSSSLKAMEFEPDLCDVLIIDSAFSDLPTMFMRGFHLKVGLPHYPFFPVMRAIFHYLGRCDIQKMSPVETVKNIKKPILFMHSCNDAFIPAAHSLKLYSHARSDKSKIAIGPNCRHGWLHNYHPHWFKRKVSRFLNRTVFAEKF